MKLDDDLTTLLAGMSEDPAFVRPTATDLAGARASHERDALRFTPLDARAAVGDVHEIELPAGGGLQGRVYRPSAEVANLPTVVWYHGGGWTTGSLATGDILSRALCERVPAVVVSVAYRLAPEHRWPAAADDAVAALAWVAEHVADFGGERSLLAVGGDSAGGNLAAVAAQAARDMGVELAAQILVYPFLDLDLDAGDERYPSLRENATGYYVTLDDLYWCVGNYLPADADPTTVRISPGKQQDFTGIAPAVVAVAEYDPLRDQGVAYAEALRRSSSQVSLHEGKGLVHGYGDMLGISEGARSEMHRVLDGVREVLAGRRPAVA